MMNVLGFFSSHLVGLMLRIRIVNEEKSKIIFYSGTIISYSKLYFFCTAGHIVKELMELQKDTSVKIELSRWVDIFGNAVIDNNSIPTDLTSAFKAYIDDRNSKMDVGLIQLHANHARMMSKNGIIPFSYDEIVKGAPIRFEKLYIVGFPSRDVSYNELEGSVSVKPTLIPAIDLSRSPDASPNRLCGKIIEIPDGFDIDGMSGGPIIGVYKDNEGLKYWLAGIQASWINRKREIFGTRAVNAIGFIEKIIFDQGL
jgi:hypothetical protein